MAQQTKEGIAPKEDKEIVKPKGGALATAEDTGKLSELLSARSMTLQQFQVLRDVIHPNASSPASVLMAFDYCRARNLDPFKKVVHIVPAWSKKTGTMVDTIWPGIAEVRTTAHRTGTYLGCDEVVFGPEMTREFTPKLTVTFPQWAQMTVYKLVNGERIAFPGPKVRWLEEYATEKHDSIVPNSMWAQRPYGQVEKCAEAAALRRAWPEETDMTAEEMRGKALDEDYPVSEGAPPPVPSVKVVVEKAAEKKVERKAEPPKPVTGTTGTATTTQTFPAATKAGGVSTADRDAGITPKDNVSTVATTGGATSASAGDTEEEAEDAEIVESQDAEEEPEEDEAPALAAPSVSKAREVKWK